MSELHWVLKMPPVPVAKCRNTKGYNVFALLKTLGYLGALNGTKNAVLDDFVRMSRLAT